MIMPTVRAGCLSITGDYRDNNEDRYQTDPDGRFFLVADGMGGQSAGEKASEMAIELIGGQLDETVDFAVDSPDEVIEKIDRAVAHANTEIMALSQLEPSFHNMGTTVAFVVTAADKLLVSGVGDSRVYLAHDGRLDQLTTDHSLTQALIDAQTIAPEEAATHRYRNVLYRYLGSKEGGNGTQPELIEPNPGDRLIICSDGVTDGLDNERLAELLAESDDPQSAAESIVAAAEAGGSRDNITCLVLFVE